MGQPTTSDVHERLAAGRALDDLWSETMGLPEVYSKERPLRLIAELLDREGVPYALIGGVAVQLYTDDPRTTLDIDLAVRRYADIPHDALLRGGFEHTGRHQPSDNWRAPGPGSVKLRTAVQFSAEDEGLADAVAHASVIDLDDGLRLRVATVADLVVLKLAAAEEATRRASKRQHDVADVMELVESHAELRTRTVLDRLHRVRSLLMSAEPALDEPGS